MLPTAVPHVGTASGSKMDGAMGRIETFFVSYSLNNSDRFMYRYVSQKFYVLPTERIRELCVCLRTKGKECTVEN